MSNICASMHYVIACSVINLDFSVPFSLFCLTWRINLYIISNWISMKIIEVEKSHYIRGNIWVTIADVVYVSTRIDASI